MLKVDRPVALAVAAVGVLIAVSSVVGVELNRRGVYLLLPSPPLIAYWRPHVGWGTPLVVACVLVGLRLQRAATTIAWRRLLLAGWLLNLAWMMSLALIDGLDHGWIQVLLNPNEYLHDLPRISDPLTFLRTYTAYVAFGPGVGDDQVWTTHVAGHPPLTTLFFWLLHAVGLGGGFWAGAACILVGSAAAVAVPLALADLGARTAARRLVPLAALFPGAVWMAVSADGLFAGVATAGLALAVRGATRRRLASSVAGGVLLGAAVFLSYGLVLFGLTVVTALVITARRQGVREIWAPWLTTVAGALSVAVVHLALGFNWFAGLAALHTRYYQGVASSRPFGYFVWANLAAFFISCSPVLAAGLVYASRASFDRLRTPLRQAQGTLGRAQETVVVALMGLSGVAAALVADVSALSKAETERIWLSFGVIATSTFALFRGRAATIALVAAASTAIAVNHLFDTGW